MNTPKICIAIFLAAGVLCDAAISASAATVATAEQAYTDPNAVWTGFGGGVPDLSATDYLDTLVAPFTVGAGSAVLAPPSVSAPLTAAGLAVLNSGAGSLVNNQTIIVQDGAGQYVRLLIDLRNGTGKSALVEEFNSYGMVTSDARRNYQKYNLYGSNSVSVPAIVGDPAANGWSAIANVDAAFTNSTYITNGVHIDDIDQNFRYLLFDAFTSNAIDPGYYGNHYVELDVVGVPPAPNAVAVGSSTLIATLDYSDTYTGTADGGIPGRTTTGAYPVNAPGTNVEACYGNPQQVWTNGRWSLNTDLNVLPTGGSPYPGTSGAGSATGITQTGGAVDFGIEYGLRDNYIVQADFIQTGDRVDITSGASRDTIAPANGLAVFFRADTHALSSIGLYKAGVGETGVLDGPDGNTGSELLTGIAVGQWNNYAVNFNQAENTLGLYVNQTLLKTLDLTTFAGGAYQGYSNAAVSVGAAGNDRTWSDNFQVGGVEIVIPPDPLPDPGPLAGLPAGLVSYWDFDEASGPVEGYSLNYAYDRQDGNDGSFEGIATRVAGLIGLGAAKIDGSTGPGGVNVGPGAGGNFSMTTGLTVEAMILPDADLGSLVYEEIFRKEDGENRILLSFQLNGSILSFGMNDGTGYKELDMPLDGSAGVTLADLKDGGVHHIAAAYDSATGAKTIFVDGTARYSEIVSPGINMISGGATSAYIGSSNLGEEPFNGVIDEVAVWNRALSAGEIGLHYGNVLAGNNYFVPEPSTWLLTLLSLAFLTGCAWRRRAAG